MPRDKENKFKHRKKEIKCPPCDGTGEVTNPKGTSRNRKMTCPHCNGDGSIFIG